MRSKENQKKISSS